MYVGWVCHPNLYIDVFNGQVPLNSIPMVVDGHVCKVLARTGFLPTVLIEEKKPIVKAEDERSKIEMHVKTKYSYGDFFAIDYGAFYIGINYCKETSPQCSKCPVDDLYRKNVQVRAY